MNQRGVKWNQDKPKLSLIDPDFSESMAKVLNLGENRYGVGNWKLGLKYSEVLDALKRHTAAIERGEDIDPDTGEPHATSIACNAMFLNWYQNRYMEHLDDRHHRMQGLQKDLTERSLLQESASQERPTVSTMFKQDSQPTAAGSQGEVAESPVASSLPPKPPADPVVVLQERIASWADRVFPDRTPHGSLCKMVMEEIPELLNGGLDDPLEYADVLILLLDVAHLRGIDAIAAAHQKMGVNERRKWQVDPETNMMHHLGE